MKNLILSAIAAITMTACDNEAQFTPQLPAITQTGANTFGAIINWQIMIPRNTQGYIPPGNTHYAVDYYTSDNWEVIRASDGKTKMGGLYIYI